MADTPRYQRLIDQFVQENQCDKQLADLSNFNDSKLFAKHVSRFKQEISHFIDSNDKRVSKDKFAAYYLAHTLQLPYDTLANITYLWWDKKQAINYRCCFLDTMSEQEYIEYLCQLILSYAEDDVMYLAFAPKLLDVIPDDSFLYLATAASLWLRLYILWEYDTAAYYLEDVFTLIEYLDDAWSDFQLEVICAYGKIRFDYYIQKLWSQDTDIWAQASEVLQYTKEIFRAAARYATTLHNKALVQYRQALVMYEEGNRGQALLDMRMSTTVYHTYYLNAQIFLAWLYKEDKRYTEVYHRCLLPAIEAINNKKISHPTMHQLYSMYHILADSFFQLQDYQWSYLYYKALYDFLESWDEWDMLWISEHMSEIYTRYYQLLCMKNASTPSNVLSIDTNRTITKT